MEIVKEDRWETPVRELVKFILWDVQDWILFGVHQSGIVGVECLTYLAKRVVSWSCNDFGDQLQSKLPAMEFNWE